MNIDTSLQGFYYIEDENRNVLSSSKNLITNWGMERLFGYTTTTSRDYNLAFCNNFKNLFIGSEDTVATYTDFRLVSAISTGYTVANDPTSTGTVTSIDGNGDLSIQFTKSNKYTITSPLVIKEVGCSWSTTLSANNDYGIFSRAVLTPSVSVNSGDIVYVKYVLNIRTNSSRVINNIPFPVGVGSVAFPNNRTTARGCPFYKLLSDGTPEASLNLGNTVGALGQDPEYMPPLFEDFNNQNNLYVGDGNTGNVINSNAGKSAMYRSWMLRSESTTTTFVSSTYSTFSNSTAITLHHPNCSYYATGVNAGVYTTSEINTVNVANGIWSKRLRFIFGPGSFIASTQSIRLMRGTKPSGTYQGYYLNNTQDGGILTALQTPYTPTAGDYVGMDYTFTFTR